MNPFPNAELTYHTGRGSTLPSITAHAETSTRQHRSCSPWHGRRASHKQEVSSEALKNVLPRRESNDSVNPSTHSVMFRCRRLSRFLRSHVAAQCQSNPLLYLTLWFVARRLMGRSGEKVEKIATRRQRFTCLRQLLFGGKSLDACSHGRGSESVNLAANRLLAV
jgi:hypothetical protein